MITRLSYICAEMLCYILLESYPLVCLCNVAEMRVAMLIYYCWIVDIFSFLKKGIMVTVN
jgi:hypothetical protein